MVNSIQNDMLKVT